MAFTRTIRNAGAALLLGLAPAAAQQLENSQTPATSGTVGTAREGRASGANLSPGDKGPAAETQMPQPTRRTKGRGDAAVRAGGSDATKELFQH